MLHQIFSHSYGPVSYADFGSFKNDVQLNILEWNEVNKKMRLSICRGFIVQYWLVVWKSEIFTHLGKQNAQKRYVIQTPSAKVGVSDVAFSSDSLIFSWLYFKCH